RLFPIIARQGTSYLPAMHRHQRRPAPSSILAGVKTFTAKRVGNERLSVEVEPCAVRGLRGRNIYRPASVPATERSACSNIAGKSLPRFAARRRIPAQAFAVK